ncbi:MAG: hypothetical protein BGO01_00410 [Armatimonadetes bacterium 55-13]|nr:MAG: hypothetical protein ABT09_02755 [bacterium SCN 57-13]OJU63161.1 MAG: hypothetical protein BGO01_00410 [Armatimonadetes bacterium 55-13]
MRRITWERGRVAFQIAGAVLVCALPFVILIATLAIPDSNKLSWRNAAWVAGAVAVGMFIYTLLARHPLARIKKEKDEYQFPFHQVGPPILLSASFASGVTNRMVVGCGYLLVCYSIKVLTRSIKKSLPEDSELFRPALVVDEPGVNNEGVTKNPSDMEMMELRGS